MQTAFTVLTVGLLVWLALYYTYWWLVRPAFVAKLRLTLTTIEGEIITMLLDTQRPDRRDPLRLVLARCIRAKRNVDSLSLSRVCLAEISPEVEENFKRERATIAVAADDIREINDRITYRLYFALLVNSPLFASIGIGLAATMEIFGSVKRFVSTVTDRSWEAMAAGENDPRSTARC